MFIVIAIILFLPIFGAHAKKQLTFAKRTGIMIFRSDEKAGAETAVFKETAALGLKGAENGFGVFALSLWSFVGESPSQRIWRKTEKVAGDAFRALSRKIEAFFGNRRGLKIGGGFEKCECRWYRGQRFALRVFIWRAGRFLCQPLLPVDAGDKRRATGLKMPLKFILRTNVRRSI